MKNQFVSVLFVFLLFPIEIFCQSDSEFLEMVNEIYKWDIEVKGNSSLMFLDVLYNREGYSEEEYLTICVAKSKNQKRPSYISIIVPNNVSMEAGIALGFGNIIFNKHGEPSLEMDENQICFTEYEGCNNETCTARVISGYLVDPESENFIDVFNNFLKFEDVYFLISYPDGSNKSIKVPLKKFQEQYLTL